MGLEVIFGIGSLLAALVALTGVVINRDGAPAFLVKSIWLRLISGVIAVALMVVAVSLDQSKKGAHKHEMLEKRLSKLTGEIKRLQAASQRQIDDTHYAAFRSSKKLAHKVLGNQNCGGRDELYLSDTKPPDGDFCGRIAMQRYAISFASLRGLDKKEASDLIKTVEAVGLSVYPAQEEERTFADRDYLAAVFPKETPHYLVCRSILETNKFLSQIGKKRIRFAVTTETVVEAQGDDFHMAPNLILLGENVHKFLKDVKPINKPWADICAYSANDFRAYVSELADEAKQPDGA